MARYEILLLGDGSHSFRTMGWVLEYKGFSIKAVTGPDAALEALVKKDYDLFIANLSREEKDNLAVVRQAKRIDPSIKVMLLTDRLDLAFPLEAYNIDINDYIIMPVSAHEFCRRVATCLEGLVVDLAPANSLSRSVPQAEKLPYNPVVHEPMVSVSQQ